MATLGSNDINIGSGEIFIKEITTSFPMPTSDSDWLAIAESTSGTPVEANRLGHIKNGATLSYEATYYDAKDDLNMVQKTIATEENVSFKCGVMTWNPDTLEKLISTAKARKSTSTLTDNDQVEIGGLQNYQDRKYACVFKSVDGVHFLYFVGQSKTSFELALQPGQETVVDAEFSCIPDLVNTEGKHFSCKWLKKA